MSAAPIVQPEPLDVQQFVTEILDRQTFETGLAAADAAERAAAQTATELGRALTYRDTLRVGMAAVMEFNRRQQAVVSAEAGRCQ